MLCLPIYWANDINKKIRIYQKKSIIFIISYVATNNFIRRKKTRKEKIVPTFYLMKKKSFLSFAFHTNKNVKFTLYPRLKRIG